MTERVWSIVYKPGDIDISAEWYIERNGTKFRLFPKTTLFAISVISIGLHVRSCFKQAKLRDKYRNEIDTIHDKYEEKAKNIRTNKYREGYDDAVKRITSGRIAPEILAKYVDFALHNKERKRRAEADKNFKENEERFNKEFNNQ